nr:immunoglobulin heavy chain junction region [Mus musculus]
LCEVLRLVLRCL